MNLETVMLTGHTAHAAAVVADQLRITELQAQGREMARVGGGMNDNDAPTLVQADVSVAIGAGTDVAVETADVVLVRSDPAGVVMGIAMARKMQRKVKQNMF